MNDSPSGRSRILGLVWGLWAFDLHMIEASGCGLSGHDKIVSSESLELSLENTISIPCQIQIQIREELGAANNYD